MASQARRMWCPYAYTSRANVTFLSAQQWYSKKLCLQNFECILYCAHFVSLLEDRTVLNGWLDITKLTSGLSRSILSLFSILSKQFCNQFLHKDFPTCHEKWQATVLKLHSFYRQVQNCKHAIPFFKHWNNTLTVKHKPYKDTTVFPSLSDSIH